MTCIGNSGGLDENIVNAIEQNDLVCCGVLSGNRNFEGRIHPNTRANYLASPLLVIAYAIAGRVDIDFETEPLGKRADGSDVYLKEIWPTRSEIHEVEKRHVIPAMFKEVYEKIEVGSEKWQTLNAPAGKSPQLPVYLYYLTLIKTCIIRQRVKLQIIFYLVLKKLHFLKFLSGKLYPWSDESTYIKKPPYFNGMTRDLPQTKPITGARVLLYLGDSVTTDHISPAGSIGRTSPAAR